MLAFMMGVPHKRIAFRDHCLASNSFDPPALHKHYLAVCNLVKDRSCKFNVFSLITKYQCMTTACCHTEYRCHDCPVVVNERPYACSYTLSTVFLSHSAYSVPSDAAVGSCVWRKGEKLWLSLLSMVQWQACEGLWSAITAL